MVARPREKPDCTLMQSGSSPEVGEEKPAMCQHMTYDGGGREVSPGSNKYGRKNQPSMAGMQMLHCTIVTIHLYLGSWRTNQEP